MTPGMMASAPGPVDCASPAQAPAERLNPTARRTAFPNEASIIGTIACYHLRMKRAAVLGAGAWGTALAKLLSDKGERVVLYTRRPEMPAEILRTRTNERYLPGIRLAIAHDVQERFAGERMRVYTSDDPIGVELGGALKNVIAIAAGACEGLGYGHNSRAALITRGLAEIVRLSMAKGGNALTLAGLAGL